MVSHDSETIQKCLIVSFSNYYDRPLPRHKKWSMLLCFLSKCGEFETDRTLPKTLLIKTPLIFYGASSDKIFSRSPILELFVPKW